MAIVDTDNMMSQPKGLTSASGVDVLTHALEAFVSIMASDYTNPLALEAGRLVFEYLPRAYDNPDDVEARDHMANASCLAGMAFANAFLGVNHSMAHKLGAFHHIPHGWANAVILTRVMRYNAAERPTKMGTFSQYQRPQAKERYCRFARYCGFMGANDDEVFENFIAGIEELKAHVGVKPTIREFGVDEQYFLDTLDDMSKQAFNDQCTGANPRYPLISEIRELYLDAYYDRPASSYED
jgi:acetaldehyde dehydrogenase/alcohol dehydrogenase